MWQNADESWEGKDLEDANNNIGDIVWQSVTTIII